MLRIRVLWRRWLIRRRRVFLNGIKHINRAPAPECERTSFAWRGSMRQDRYT